MMEYTEFQYIKPLRAETALPPSQIPSLESEGGWLAQFKKNGTNNLIFVAPDKSLLAYNRHGEPQKMWKFTPESAEVFTSLPGNGWYVINTELMHSKTTITKNTNYIHDILVCNGTWLFGRSYIERYDILFDLFFPHSNGDVTKSHIVINKNTWLARNYTKDFRSLYDGITDLEDEGLVFKKGKIPFMPRMPVGWTFKCRKQHKNYSF